MRYGVPLVVNVKAWVPSNNVKEIKNIKKTLRGTVERFTALPSGETADARRGAREDVMVAKMPFWSMHRASTIRLLNVPLCRARSA